MVLGYPHPDHLLRQLTSRQLTEWMAYATIEQVGNPVAIPDPVADRKDKRGEIEAGFKRMQEKQ